MSWWQLLQRAWAAWQLSRVKFEFCHTCNIPLCPEERGFYCTECKEKQPRNDIASWTAQGSWNQLFAPDLTTPYNSAREAQVASYQQQLALQQQQQAANPYQSALAQQMQLQNETQEQRAQRMNLLGQLGGVLGGLRGGYGNH